MNNLNELREQEHRQRLEANRLRREVYQQTSPAASGELLDSLREAEKVLSDIERKRAQAQAKDLLGNGLILDTEKDTGLLGPQTTCLEARLHLRMAQVPTSICHLLNPDLTPLISCSVRNVEEEGKIRRLRVISFIEGYSAQAVDTVELEPLSKPHEFNQLPTLFPDRLRTLNELTRATLNVLVEDLDGKIELHQTKPIWLLARTTAPLAVMDPMTGQWQDLTRYFGAFVTPNAPSLMMFLRLAAKLHPQGSLTGYQGDQDGVIPQVKALFDALKTEAHITYVNSVIAFSPEDGFASQRVRLPRKSLQEKQANCIDGTVLFASLLEGISMSPAIIVVPGHAFVAWETWENSNEWKYMETTMIGSHTFEQACASAESQAKFYQALADNSGDESHFRRWPLRELRAVHGITPME
jgi:hypothetical protein